MNLLSIIFTQPILFALLFTLVIELAVLVLFKVKDIRIYLVMFTVNCITNISMNVGLHYLPYQQDILYLSLAEIIVFIIEALILTKLLKNVKLGFFISFIANVLSLVLGLWIIPMMY